MNNKDKLFEEKHAYELSMNTEIAVNKAIAFAKKHGNPYARLFSVRKKGMIWYVRLDVGAFIKDLRTVKVDDSGKIIGFTK